jgi:hypothetical protein
VNTLLIGVVILVAAMSVAQKRKKTSGSDDRRREFFNFFQERDGYDTETRNMCKQFRRPSK